MLVLEELVNIWLTFRKRKCPHCGKLSPTQCRKWLDAFPGGEAIGVKELFIVVLLLLCNIPWERISWYLGLDGCAPKGDNSYDVSGWITGCPILQATLGL